MRSVKMLTDRNDSTIATADRWYVTNGVTAVGPVDTDLLARGIEAGKVPMESFVRHEAWKVWRPLSEIAILTSDTPPSSGPSAPPPVSVPPPASDDITLPGGGGFEALAASLVDPTFPGYPAVPWPSSAGGGDDRAGLTSADDRESDDLTPLGRAPFPADSPLVSEPDFPMLTRPPLLSESSASVAARNLSRISNLPRSPYAPSYAPSNDSSDPPCSLTPSSFPPAPISLPDEYVEPVISSRKTVSPPRFDMCAVLPDALLLLLSTAVESVQADTALLHQVYDDGAVAVCAHGPCMAEMLGKRTALTDPAVMAAASGLCVVAEPSPGPAGRSIVNRLAALGAVVGGAVMIPIRPHGRLFGMLELGRRAPFSPCETAAACELVERFAVRIEAAYWS